MSEKQQYAFVEKVHDCDTFNCSLSNQALKGVSIFAGLYDEEVPTVTGSLV
jgi:hypothetical protein